MHMTKTTSVCSALILQALIFPGFQPLKAQEVEIALKFAGMAWTLEIINAMMATTEMETVAHRDA